MQCENLVNEASKASECRIEALKHLLAAMLDSTVDQPSFNNLRIKIEQLGLPDATDLLAQDLRQLFKRPENEPNSQDWSVLRNSLRYAAQQLICPSADRPRFIKPLQPDLDNWVNWIRQAKKLNSTSATDTFGQTIAHSDSLSTFSAECIDQAIQLQRQSIEMLNKLITQGAMTNESPMFQIVRIVRKSRNAKSVAIDELLSNAVLRMYERIDSFYPDTNFPGWWRSLVDRCLLDSLGQVVENLSLIDNIVGSSPSDDPGQTEPFGSRDWETIRQWAMVSILTPILVCVGFGWLGKIRRKSEHWEEFSGWLSEFGIEDVNAFFEESSQTEAVTSQQISVLAKYSCRSESNLRPRFNRSFAGIHQSIRQTSFGKSHHAVELEYFWSAIPIYGPKIGKELQRELNNLDVESRVAAFCCSPAWPLVRDLDVWNDLKAGYPFLSTPPMLEFIQFDLNVKSEHLKYLPPHIKTNREKLGYIREQILVHGTKGRFIECQESIASARKRAESVERELSELWSDTVFG